MKKIALSSVLIFMLYFNAYSQEVSCEELLDFVKENGYQKSSISKYILNSSWLNTVTAYDYDGKIFVVAEIKKDEYSYTTKEYVFCAIPFFNWQNFEYGGSGDSQSYGQRFHKYIMDHKCKCD